MQLKTTTFTVFHKEPLTNYRQDVKKVKTQLTINCYNKNFHFQ